MPSLLKRVGWVSALAFPPIYFLLAQSLDKSPYNRTDLPKCGHRLRFGSHSRNKLPSWGSESTMLRKSRLTSCGDWGQRVVRVVGNIIVEPIPSTGAAADVKNASKLFGFEVVYGKRVFEIALRRSVVVRYMKHSMAKFLINVTQNARLSTLIFEQPCASPTLHGFLLSLLSRTLLASHPGFPRGAIIVDPVPAKKQEALKLQT
eukprot:6484046-Amphidinium_carterae.1